MTAPNKSILEDVACPLGCSKKDEIVLTGRDLLHGLPGEFDVVKCATCGLMRTNPRPTPEAIGFYYPDDYGPYVDTRVQSTVPKRISGIKKMLKPVVKHLFKFNTNALPLLPPGRLLEVGCASGAFLHRMAVQGWQAEGIEFSGKAARAAAQLGYRVYAGPLETAPEPNEPFDLIIGWMVLEHLHDPVAGLKKLYKWAKPGAWLVLSVPNAKSLEFRIFKDKWYALQLPTHLYHFTPETLMNLLEFSGWKAEKTLDQRLLNNLIASVGYFLQSRGFICLGKMLANYPNWDGRISYIIYPLACMFGVLGQTGRMTIWAKK
jgi:2-polyprenyl-3-methyl-5-hydroxy-6-metoxy-1,4-benzoquinol methylase